jgi:hypothetical protein
MATAALDQAKTMVKQWHGSVGTGGIDNLTR